MTKIIFSLLAFLAGSGLAFQAAVNAQLRGVIGSGIGAAIISFCVGLVVLILGWVISGHSFAPHSLGGVSKWNLIGGVFGAIFILISIFIVKDLGVTRFLAFVIAGQLTASLLVDHFGLFGVELATIDIKKVIGVMLITSGVFLVR